MVFESVVVDVLNDLLGDYFENLDSSQLKLGIWGGDVSLKDLILKTSCVDKLDMPFKIVIGKLGSLTMKIPWSSLYTSPVELVMEDLLLLVAPSYSVEYDAVAEEKSAESAKRTEIDRIDEIRKKEQARDLGGDEDKCHADDTFAEKLVSQIIKNVQITINTIHIRFEDDVTKPQSPFGFGLTMKSFEVHTTDENWLPTVLVGTRVLSSHKFANLQGFGIYWNSGDKLVKTQSRTPNEMLALLKAMVQENEKFVHVLGPINSTAKVTLTSRPDLGPEPFSKPKFCVDVVMEDLAIAVSNLQFMDIIELAEAVDFMFRAQQYRKYRPSYNEHRGHYKAWWMYAYECVVEETVRRRRNNWSWSHMKRHRSLIQTYADAYYTKLTHSKLKSSTSRTLSTCEKELDLFNITLVRKQVEMRIETEGRKKEIDKEIAAERKKSRRWFGGKSKAADILEKVDGTLIEVEKARLCEALDYTEDKSPLEYPEAYEEYYLTFKLVKLSTVVKEFKSPLDRGKKVLDLVVDNVEAEIATRPIKTGGMKVNLTLGVITATGYQASTISATPVVITSKLAKDWSSLMSIQYEAHPLDSHVDQRIVVRGKALEIVYDGQTINKLYNCFTLPADAKLVRLQEAAATVLNEWKVQSVVNLQYLLDTRGEVEVDIHLEAPCLVIPQNGVLSSTGAVLVTDLGEISFKSKPRDRNWNSETAASFKNGFDAEGKFLEAMMKHAYDCFIIEFNEFQVLIALPNEDYLTALGKREKSMDSTVKTTPKSLIYTKKFVVSLEQSMLPDDSRFPRLRFHAQLPLIELDIGEHRLLELIRLLVTLPLPHSNASLESQHPVGGLHKISENAKVAEAYALSRLAYGTSKLQTVRKEKVCIEFTELLIKFSLDAVKIRLARKDGEAQRPLLDFTMNNLQFQLESKSFTTAIDVGIGGLTLCALQNTTPSLKGPLYLLKTPMSIGSDKYLLTMHMFSILPNCPPQMTGKVKQSLHVDISSLDVILHQEAIVAVINLAARLKKTISHVSSSSVPASVIDFTVSKLEARRRAVAKKHHDPRGVLLEISAKMESLTVELSCERRNLIRAVLSSLDGSLVQNTAETSIVLGLRNLNVVNMDPATLYKDVLLVSDDKVVYVKLTFFHEGTTGENFYDINKYDMSVCIETGSPRIVYIRQFLDDVFEFLVNLGASRDAMFEAGAAAALAVKGSVHGMESFRVRLDINLRAPLVICPRNEGSSQALVADLGRLILKNQFERRQEAGREVIFDKIKINLISIQVSRGYLNNGQIVSEVLVVEPVNCDLELDRNLKHDLSLDPLPPLTLKGAVRSGIARMSNEDYDLVMGTIFENILATRRADEKVSKTRAKEPELFKKMVLSGASADHRHNCASALHCSITVPQFSLIMYQSGVGKLEEAQGIVDRDESEGFASVAVENSTIIFEGFSDLSISCLITVENVSLTDIRSGERAIESLIQRKPASRGVPVAKFSFKSDESTGAITELDVDSLTLVLDLVYLFKILEFFQKSSPKTPKRSNATLGHLATPARAINQSWLPRAILLFKPVVAETNLRFNACYNISSVQIILVETMERINTKALLVNCEIVANQTASGGKSILMGTISNLKACSCIYDPRVRERSSAEVVAPISVTVDWNESAMAGSLIDLAISDIFVRLNAGTVELLTKIFGSMMTVSGNKLGENEEKTVKVDSSDIWSPKEISSQHFWFLQPEAEDEIGQDALICDSELTEALKIKERLILRSGSIVLTFETGAGHSTLPLVLIETNIDVQILDWSETMKIEGKMKLEAACYNPMFGMWEFLVEPVETGQHGKGSHQPWELLFEVTLGANHPTDTADSQATNSIWLQSSDVLELTLTKTAIKALKIIMDDFSSAVKELGTQRQVTTAAYTVINQTGMELKIYLKETATSASFVPVLNGPEKDQVLLNHGTEINLDLNEEKTKDSSTRRHSSVLRDQERKVDRLLTIAIPELDWRRSIPVNRTGKRYFSLEPHVEEGHYGLICDIGVNDCSKVVTFRGVVQVINDLKVPVDVYYTAVYGKGGKLAGTAKPSSLFNLPISCTDTQSCALFFAPEGYSGTTQPFLWDDVFEEAQVIKNLSARSLKHDHEDFHIRVVGRARQGLHECFNRKSNLNKCCNISLKPPLFLDNLLPTQLGYYLPGQENWLKIAERGSILHLTNLVVAEDETYNFTLRIPEYKGVSWECEVNMRKSSPPLSTWTFTSQDSPGETLTLGIHRETVDDELLLHVYSPFWMMNRTGLDLLYQGDSRDDDVVTHPTTHETPVMFSLSGNAFFTKKGARVKVIEPKIRNITTSSDWSDKFSLETAGSCGSVTCKSPLQNFQIGVTIQMSSCGLTRNVILTPRFYLSNQSHVKLYVLEVDTTEVPSGSVVPFWPKSETRHLKVAVCGIEGMTETEPFGYDTTEHTVLKLANEFARLHVDIILSESKTLIQFGTAVPTGQAPVLLINKLASLPIQISEQDDLETVSILHPGMCQYYTWRNPLGSRMLEWWPQGETSRHQNQLRMDGYGEMEQITDHQRYYWISFLDGPQRCLLFTEDVSIVQRLQAGVAEDPSCEYTVLLHGLGLSLVDNEAMTEVMYMRIASSDIIWEQCKDGKRKGFKPMTMNDSKAVEAAYQTNLNQEIIQAVNKFDSGLEVDFYSMRATKPNFARIRRVFRTGIWLSYKMFPHSCYFHAKLNRIQIDSQLRDSTFRVVLAPVKPPKTVVHLDTKPFVEVSIMQKTSHSDVVEFKYFKVLVQEFLVKVDLQFLNALVELVDGDTKNAVEWRGIYLKDYEQACVPLTAFYQQQLAHQGQRNFYDYLHISPLKIHLSFSMYGSTNLSNHGLRLIMASLGATLTEVHDCVFKLACFEVHQTFLSTEQLREEVESHYLSQGLRQFYVLVFGLDVIGNPYGLAMGMAKGVEAFFYEPFQGAIQGPAEFAEGIELGVKSLWGGAVGGTAGAFSKITGTLGKGIAALTFDDDYQEKRRAGLHNRGDAAEGLVRSGKGLVMGFYEGVTGLVIKPIEGCREGGAFGFFKGVIKGTVGLVAIPAAGVIDFASGSLEAVKKATSSIEGTRQLRQPRFIPTESILQPYSCHETKGESLLFELEKGNYANSDSYVAHALINPIGSYVVMVTNRRILYLRHEELFDTWTTEWGHIWEEFSRTPEIVEGGLRFHLKQEKVRKLFIFRLSGLKELLVPMYSTEVATWLASKIGDAMEIESGVGLDKVASHTNGIAEGVM